MATRYYLPSSSAAPSVSPAFDISWSNTTAFSPDRVTSPTVKSNTARTAKSVSPAQSVHANYLARQYITAAIGVFNFTGTTVSGIWQIQGTTGFTQGIVASIRLVHLDGSFDSLLGLSQFDTGLSSTAAQTRIIAAGTALGSITSQNNDRIVIELGESLTVGSTTVTISSFFGDVSATVDYALTSGLTTTLDPWIEFSGTLPAPSLYNAKGQFLQFF